jgi:hypothetical protein
LADLLSGVLWDQVEAGEGRAVLFSDPDGALAHGQAGGRDARQGDGSAQHPVAGGVDPVQLARLGPIRLVPARGNRACVLGDPQRCQPKAISTPLGILMVATTWPVAGSMRCTPASVALLA